MEMRLFEVAGETFTRFKVSKKQYFGFKKILSQFGITNPVKQNSRFIYFEMNGDYLNYKVEGEK